MTPSITKRQSRLGALMPAETETSYSAPWNHPAKPSKHYISVIVEARVSIFSKMGNMPWR